MCRTNGNYIVQLQNYKLIYLANSQVIHKIWSRSTPGSLQLPNNETCVSCVNGSCEARILHESLRRRAHSQNAVSLYSRTTPVTYSSTSVTRIAKREIEITSSYRGLVL